MTTLDLNPVADEIIVNTSRFGSLVVSPEAVVSFPDGLLGFAGARRFVAVPHGPAGSPFVWLQSLERPDLAFLLVPPALACPGYAPPLPKEAKTPDAQLWAIATVPAGRPREMSVNLLGPLVISGNAGRQIVLDTDRYSARHPVLPAA